MNNEDWHPDEDEMLEHQREWERTRKEWSALGQIEQQELKERLVQNIRKLRGYCASLSKKPEDAEAYQIAGFDVLSAEMALEDFYSVCPGQDPANDRWSKEFRDIGTDKELREVSWVDETTWTGEQGINLCFGYRAERPSSLWASFEARVVQRYEADLFVSLHPVNASVAISDVFQYRFRPSEFATWFFVYRGVPRPFNNLVREKEVRRSPEVAGNVHGNVGRFENEREQKLMLIELACQRYPDEIVERGATQGAIAEVAIDHWVSLAASLSESVGGWRLKGPPSVTQLSRICGESKRKYFVD